MCDAQAHCPPPEGGARSASRFFFRFYLVLFHTISFVVNLVVLLSVELGNICVIYG